ncbi:MAG: hypothetical protein ACJAT2_002405 [Bacteriovoracaceae bacterium]|jgi:hypothetical protein
MQVILSLTLLVSFIILDSFFRESLKSSFKKIGMILSVVVVAIGLLSSTQGISFTGFLVPEGFNLFKTLFLIVLTTTIAFDKEALIISKKLVSVLLLTSNVIEFQASFLLAYLIVEEVIVTKRSNYKINAFLFLIITCSLMNIFDQYGEGLIALIFIAKLLYKELCSSETTNPTSAIFYSIVVLTFTKNLSLVTFQIPLVLITMVYLFNSGKKLLRGNSTIFLSFMTLSFTYLTILALAGLSQLFYFIGTFLFIAAILRRKEDKESFHWNLFFILMFFSPPFGIGYMSKSEVFEVLLMKPWPLILFVGLTILLLQAFSFLLFSKVKGNLLESLKNFNFSTDIKGSVFIILSIAMSLLFLPENWITGYGNLFNTKFYPAPNLIIERFGIGYYLFWLELLIWLSAILIFYKTSPDFFKRIYFNNILLFNEKEAPVSGKELSKSKDFINGNYSILKNIVTALELGKNKLNPQYFSLMMLVVFGLLLAGLV